MDQDKQPRRVKVVDATAHRTGTHRGAVKPHKRVSEPDVKQLIATFMGNLKTRLSQTYYGDTIAKNAKILASNFGLASGDEPYLLLDASSGRGQAGMLLSKAGVSLADGRGGKLTISWKDMAQTNVAYQNNMLVIGQNGIASADGKVLVTLLEQIKAKFA